MVVRAVKWSDALGFHVRPPNAKPPRPAPPAQPACVRPSHSRSFSRDTPPPRFDFDEAAAVAACLLRTRIARGTTVTGTPSPCSTWSYQRCQQRQTPTASRAGPDTTTTSTGSSASCRSAGAPAARRPTTRAPLLYTIPLLTSPSDARPRSARPTSLRSGAPASAPRTRCRRSAPPRRRSLASAPLQRRSGGRTSRSSRSRTTRTAPR